MCRNNTGSDDAYIAVTEAIGTAVVCVMTSVDVKNLISDVNTISNETRGTFFPKYCPQLKRAGSCLDDLVKAFSPCLHKYFLTNVLTLTGMYPDAVDLVCKTDGEIMFMLAEPKTKECISKLCVKGCTVPFHLGCDNWDISNLTETQMG
ncbi:uncharacterized protein LOC131267131 [Anopheles coustani]|uniref:uncharacterized protein LOC131267131 n=1 Tax=Anopheles coustani TaxID=139045 RepID=UPI00265AF44D|nr:uncharacterized protein LOC131267131 [Anopheles coustani]